MPADSNFFMTLHGKGDNDSAGGDVNNTAWRKVLQDKAVLQEKFPNFVIEEFKSNEICDATKHLP